MLDKILVTLDGSKLAELVLPEVEKLATHSNIEVTLMQVIPQVSYRDQGKGEPVFYIDELVGQAVVEAKTYLSKVADDLRERGINVKIATRYGNVPNQVVDFANRNGVNLIAMCTHGRSGISRLINGSVAEAVLRTAKVPVFLVKPNSAAWARHTPSKQIAAAAN